MQSNFLFSKQKSAKQKFVIKSNIYQCKLKLQTSEYYKLNVVEKVGSKFELMRLLQKIIQC